MRQVPPKAAYLAILGTQGFARGLLFAALLSYWVLQARFGPLQLVLLGTALEGTLFCLQIPTGAFADGVGRRPATAIGYVLLGVGLGAQALTRDFASLLLLQALSGAAWAFLIGSMEAWIAEAAPSAPLERVFLRGGQAEIAGLMGGLCATVLLGQIDPRLPILAGGALLLVVGAGASALMREEPRAAGAGGARIRTLVSIAGAGLRQVRGNRTLSILVLLALALGASSEGWDRLYTAHLLRDLGLGAGSRLSPVGWLSLIGLVECVLGVAAFEVAARQLRARRPGLLLAVIYLAQGCLMVAFAAVAWLPAALTGFVAAETVRRLGGPLLEAWTARETVPEVRATVLSAAGQADALGQIVAGPLVGLLGNLASVPVALAVSAALLAPAALLASAGEAGRVQHREEHPADGGRGGDGDDPGGDDVGDRRDAQ